MKLVSKSDIIFTAVICAAAILLFFVFSMMPKGQTVAITKKGETIGMYDLSENREITVGGDFENHILIKGGRVCVESSTCKNQNCVKSGSIEKSGQTIVCAPNGVVITIKGESEIDGISR